MRLYLPRHYGKGNGRSKGSLGRNDPPLAHPRQAEIADEMGGADADRKPGKTGPIA
jgi:hypothetical protein